MYLNHALTHATTIYKSQSQTHFNLDSLSLSLSFSQNFLVSGSPGMFNVPGIRDWNVDDIQKF